MKKLAEKGLFELIKTMAGGRVYAVRAPQNVQAPFIVFQRVDSQRWRSINNPSGIAQATIQFDVYASEYYEAKEIGSEIEEILDGFMGDVAYGDDSPQEVIKIGGISLENDIDLIDQTDEPYLHRSSASYLVTYHQ